MPRRMSFGSRDRIAALVQENPKAVGPKLGHVALKYNIPARAMADMVRVSEPTMYRWFYGEAEPRAIYLPKIRRMMQLFRLASETGDIPLEGTYGQRMLAIRDVIIKHKPRPIE